MADEGFSEAEEALWRRVVDTLLTRGASSAEAIDGANLVLRAYRRQRDAATAEDSGMRRIEAPDARPGRRRCG